MFHAGSDGPDKEGGTLRAFAAAPNALPSLVAPIVLGTLTPVPWIPQPLKEIADPARDFLSKTHPYDSEEKVSKLKPEDMKEKESVITAAFVRAEALTKPIGSVLSYQHVNTQSAEHHFSPKAEAQTAPSIPEQGKRVRPSLRPLFASHDVTQHGSVVNSKHSSTTVQSLEAFDNRNGMHGEVVKVSGENNVLTAKETAGNGHRWEFPVKETVGKVFRDALKNGQSSRITVKRLKAGGGADAFQCSPGHKNLQSLDGGTSRKTKMTPK